MSYAIIRNVKYKRDNLKGIYRHNERRNRKYSNEEIDITKSYLNYSLKDCKYSYEKEFERIRTENDLKGQIKKVSNIVCEYIITSDEDFFNKIGESETKRYFETAYKFVCEYKDLGEKYILSSKVHMDEKTPHMHLVFLPVVHTKDKNGNEIDKLACSEFWKEKDSYRRLQDAFYEYITTRGFELERGLPKEETCREHLSVKEFKAITNFEETKEKLNNITLEIPEVPELKDINKFMLKRDEKIAEEIIKPKDELIKKLYTENMSLHQELSKQAIIVEEAEKYQSERDEIIEDNAKLNMEVNNMKFNYQMKVNDLESEYEELEENLERDYMEKVRNIDNMFKKEIRELEKENKFLKKTIDKIQITIKKFVKWICRKFEIPSEDEVIRDFYKETKEVLDVKEILESEKRKEKREKEFER